MKFAIAFLSGCFIWCSHSGAHASESAPDCGSAEETLRAGIEANPENTLMFFENALQTNPGCRRALTVTAIEASNPDADLLIQIIYVARNVFPGEETLIAEAVMISAPEFGDIVRQAFMKPQAEVTAALAGPAGPPQPDKIPEEARAMDEEIREAIARMNAKIEGRPWPEQEISREPLNFKKPDEIRVSKARNIDETSLYNSLPVDRDDEQTIVPKPAKFSDKKEEEDFRLAFDDFDEKGNTASTIPKEARKKRLAPAGAVGVPLQPEWKGSSVYFIPPANYTSTIDQEEEPTPPRPKLILRSAPASETLPH